MAIMASVYVNAHLEKGAKKAEPADFIPGAKRQEPHFTFPPGVIPITPDQMRKQLQAAKFSKKAE